MVKEKKEKKTEETIKKNKLTEEDLKKLQEAFDRLTVKDIVLQMMTSLSTLGYKKLGLPEKANEKHRDLKQAKQAIDCLAALIKVMESDFTEEEARIYKGLLANLQMTYVSQSKPQ